MINRMVPKEITSLQHPFVKHSVKLREDKAFRYAERSLLLSGNAMLRDLADLISFKTVFILQGETLPPNFRTESVVVVTEEVLKKISGVAQPETLAAIAEMPAPGSLQDKKAILILDAIADPGNMGTLLRSALSFGWDAVFLTPNCVDPFNEKCLRAAKGATFAIPIIQGSKEALIEYRSPIFVADSKGKNILTCQFTPPFALVLGNESHGPSDFFSKYPKISVPISDKMESLNVAIAGSILMFEMIKGEFHG